MKIYSALGFIFVVLKLLGIINWHWLLILLPFLIAVTPLCLALVYLFITTIKTVMLDYFETRRNLKKEYKKYCRY